MTDVLVGAIASIRDSILAVLRIHKNPTRQAHGALQTSMQFEVSIVGTAWCIVADRFLLTAHHILNNGQLRDSEDRYFAFSVPANGDAAYHTPVISFPIESPQTDMAILEIAPPVSPMPSIPAAAVTFDPQQDGQRVLTYGFPAPNIARANVDPKGNWLGGNFFLKGHANEGIVASHYKINGQLFYELNVGWHHGESGGPVFRLDPIAGFAIMQQYRNIDTPHGTIPGPRQGRGLNVIESDLRNIGVLKT
jgi:hypothetical protein